MNKAELVRKIAEDAEVTQKQAAAVLDGFMNAVKAEIATGGKVQLIGFGCFEGRHRAARTAKNPKTGEAVEISEAIVPAFKPAQTFKDEVNK